MGGCSSQHGFSSSTVRSLDLGQKIQTCRFDVWHIIYRDRARGGGFQGQWMSDVTLRILGPSMARGRTLVHKGLGPRTKPWFCFGCGSWMSICQSHGGSHLGLCDGQTAWNQETRTAHMADQHPDREMGASLGGGQRNGFWFLPETIRKWTGGARKWPRSARVHLPEVQTFGRGVC